MKDVNEMTQKEFRALPCRTSWNSDEGILDALIILPTKRHHDSGYRCMDFVAVKKGKPICRLSGCSDVLHIDGIGGYGENWLAKYGTVPNSIPPSGWNVDCLKKSGLLRLFRTDGKIKVGTACSSFDVFAIEKR